HPLRPVLLEQAARDLVGAVVRAHLLAHQKDVRIAGELLVEGLVEGFTKRQLTHGPSPARWDRRTRRCRAPTARARGIRRRSGWPPPPPSRPPRGSGRAPPPWPASWRG